MKKCFGDYACQYEFSDFECGYAPYRRPVVNERGYRRGDEVLVLMCENLDCQRRFAVYPKKNDHRSMCYKCRPATPNDKKLWSK